MDQELVLDVVKIIMPSVLGYLVWITKTVLKQGHDLDTAFIKIRSLENEIDKGDDR